MDALDLFSSERCVWIPLSMYALGCFFFPTSLSSPSFPPDVTSVYNRYAGTIVFRFLHSPYCQFPSIVLFFHERTLGMLLNLLMYPHCSSYQLRKARHQIIGVPIRYPLRIVNP